MLDLRLSGLDVNSVSSLEKQLLKGHLRDKEYLEYVKLLIIITAIQEAAGSIINSNFKFSRTSDLVKILNKKLFPEVAKETEEKAKRVKGLIEREMSRGPIKVQRLDYGTKSRKKR